MTIDKMHFLSLKYAQAFLRVFGSNINHKDQVLAIRSAMRYLKEKPVALEALSFLAHHPEEMQNKVIKSYLHYLHLPDDFASLCLLLMKKKHHFLLALILEKILSICYEKEGAQAITIYAPYLLAESEQRQCTQFIEEAGNKKVINTEFVLQPDLIAGIKITSSSGYLWEYSLSNQVKKITAILRQEGMYREQ